MDTTTIIITLGALVIQLALAAAVSYATGKAFLARLDQRVLHLETLVSENAEHISSIRERLATCETTLRERPTMIRRKSPITLSERGETFLRASGADKLIDTLYPELLAKVESMRPATAYDIQEDSLQAVETLARDPRLNELKNYLFQDGTTMDEAQQVMAIYLRDKILAAKNMLPADIDHPALAHA